MKNYAKHKVVPELRLTINYFSGHTKLIDIIKLKSIEIDDAEYDPDYNLIIDFRDSELFLTEDEIDEFIEHVKKNPRIGGKRKSAHITSSPEHVVSTLIFKMNAIDLPMQVEIFSTLAAASIWLGYSEYEFRKIDVIINQIRKNRS